MLSLSNIRYDTNGRKNWSIEVIYICFETSKNRVSYNLPVRIHHFFRKSTLNIDRFSNSEQFDSICLDYVYQLVESVVSHGEYEDNT